MEGSYFVNGSFWTLKEAVKWIIDRGSLKAKETLKNIAGCEYTTFFLLKLCYWVHLSLFYKQLIVLKEI